MTAGEVPGLIVRQCKPGAPHPASAGAQWGLLFFAVCAAPAAGASIDIGRVVLKPDTPGQVIPLSISGGEQVAAAELYAQLGDGGQFNGGAGTRPVFRGADLTAGTIFQDNNAGQSTDNRGLVINASVITNAGSVGAAGLLVRLTVDTTGLTAPQSFPLTLTNVAPNAPGGPFQTQVFGPDARPVPLSVTNGSVFSTYYGDANLDATVNGTDFALLARSFGRTGQTWETGDFNRDGAVNGSDFALLAQNFGRSQPATAAGAAAEASDGGWRALEAFAAARGIDVPVAAVPEPAAGAIAVAAAAGGLLRRGRKRRPAG